MTTYRLIQSVPVKEIDVESENYCFDFVPRLSNGETIALFPPVLYSEKGRLQPILGRNQLHRSREKTSVLDSALVLEGTSLGLETVLFSISLKQSLGGFSVVEKSLALRRLHSLSGTEDGEILTDIGIPRHGSTIQNMITLADSPVEIKELVHRGELHENTAFEIFRFEKDLWLELALFISKLGVGTKKRNEILSMLGSISRRDQRSVPDILEDPDIRVILQRKNIDPPQRAEILYHHLKDLRYPSIREFRQRFDRKRKAVHLNRPLQLVLPENFERWQFKLVIPFSSTEEFQQCIEELRGTAESSAFRDLMDMRF
jgi:hypothetical protein